MSPNLHPFELRREGPNAPDLDGAWEIIAWQEGYRSPEEFAANDPENYMIKVKEVSDRFGIKADETNDETG